MNAPPTINDHYLLSPLLATGVNGPTLSFDHSRNLESPYDGGVVEVAVNGGSFFDVFVTITNPWITNGYNATISNSFGSPIGGRQAFTNNLGYLNSSILLNTVLVGDTFQLRWRRASDNSVADVGWTVDNILLSDGALAGAVPEPGFAIPIVLVLSGMVLARRRRVKP